MGTAPPKVIYTPSFSNVVGSPPGQGFICGSGEAIEKLQRGEEEIWVGAELHMLRELLWKNGTGHLEGGSPCWRGARERQGPGLQEAGFRPLRPGSSLLHLTSVGWGQVGQWEEGSEVPVTPPTSLLRCGWFDQYD